LSTIAGDRRYKGNVQIETLVVNQPFIDGTDLKPGAEFPATNLQHEHRPTYSQEATADAVAGTHDFYTSRAAGEIKDFEVWLATIPDTASGGGGRTAIVDLLVNNASVLTATVTLRYANVSRIKVNATITTAAYAADAVFSVAVALGVGATGTYPKGVAAAMTVRESAA